MKLLRKFLFLGLLCYLGAGSGLAGVSSSTNGNVNVKPVMLDEFLAFYGLSGSTVVYTMRSTPQETVLDGQFVVLSTNGTKSASGNFRDGKLNGDLSLWHQNGKLSSQQHHEDGKLAGTETYWNTNGVVIRTTRWREGEKDGPEIYWDNNGGIEQRIEWDQGRPDSVELFRSGGLIQRVTGTKAVEYFRERIRKR